MNEKKDCKIVQDLLPNYIENLTNEETNKFIEEHLKTCDECKIIYDNMKKDLNVANTTKEKKKVKFLKKYRNKLRILEIIILIIVVAFIVNTGRKMYIITDLNNKAQEYIKLENYRRTSYSLYNGIYTKEEVFSMGDRKKIITTTMSENGEKEILTIYGTKIGTVPDTQSYPPIEQYKQNMYKVTDTEKLALLDVEIGMAIDNQEAFWGIENTKDLIMSAITTSINKATYDGKECYYVSNSQNILPNSSMYVNKETGLIISTMASEIKNVDGTTERIAGVEYQFEFGTVTEDDFIEPDISEYKIME